MDSNASVAPQATRHSIGTAQQQRHTHNVVSAAPTAPPPSEAAPPRTSASASSTRHTSATTRNTIVSTNQSRVQKTMQDGATNTISTRASPNAK
ncbi:unnamed protein product [Phytophthora fragariaefolia]|uniref:Unnamed protein product n=1 Tax=Phytophthora fragariaefolia TaxID=1490495 RepID=A0A9W7CQK3_9STRA|nr:unnamed protein product [Phytophthora fragariaefolia]